MTDPTGQDRIDRRASTTYPDGEATAPPMRTDAVYADPARTEPATARNEQLRDEPVTVRNEQALDPQVRDQQVRDEQLRSEQLRAEQFDGAATRPGQREHILASDGLGGVRWGAVFFGWLCATGVAVLLLAIVAATGTAIGLTESNVNDVVNGAAGKANAVSLAGAIALLVVLAVAYFSGGYVAARMARFSGKAQGGAVWALGLVITILAALGGLLLGSAYDVLARLNLPRIPIDEGTATTGAVITLVAIMLVTLLAAIFGGALGDRYHRRLDEIDLR